MIGLDINLHDIDRLNALMDRVQALDDHYHELLESLGATVESQTRRRIEEEQTAPDGTPWPAWSSGYAATRHGNQNLLQNEGHLLDSLHYVVGVDDVRIETNLIYAAIHQFGGTIKPKNGPHLVFSLGEQTVFTKEVNLPARPFMGLSDEDIDEIEQTLSNFLIQSL